MKLDALEPDEDLDSPANEESEEEKEEIVAVVIEEPKEKWDCESILSKYFGVCLYVPRISKYVIGDFRTFLTVLQVNWFILSAQQEGFP